jgi:hypothetical protein
VWSGRVNDIVLGLTGNLQGTFGEVRRRALETAAQVKPASPENPGDLKEDGQTDLPAAAPADHITRDK